MHKKKTIFEIILIYFGLTVTTLFFLLPLLWIFRTSLITKLEAYKIPPNWSATFTLENYYNIFHDNPFTNYFFNSFLVAFLTTVVSLLFGAMAAYWIARFSRGNSIRLAILMTQMIPPVVMVIPLSLIVKSMGLDDTIFALVTAYLTFNLPYVIWMLISFFEIDPRELEEAY